MRSTLFNVAYWVLSFFYAVMATIASLVPGRGVMTWVIRRYTQRMMWALHWIAAASACPRARSSSPPSTTPGATAS